MTVELAGMLADRDKSAAAAPVKPFKLARAAVKAPSSTCVPISKTAAYAHGPVCREGYVAAELVALFNPGRVAVTARW
jgi:hypothetical protein